MCGSTKCNFCIFLRNLAGLNISHCHVVSMKFNVMVIHQGMSASQLNMFQFLWSVDLWIHRQAVNTQTSQITDLNIRMEIF